MNDQTVQVAVCIPSGDDVKTDFALSLAAMLQVNRMQLDDGAITTLKYELLNMRTANLAFSRNELARAAITRGADYVLFIDADMRFPPFTACRLIEVARKTGVKIVGAVGASRISGAVCRAGERESGVIEVPSIGTGILLIHSDVFRRLAEPWFLFELGHGVPEALGEDAYFCAKAHAAGLKIAADFELTKDVAHIGAFAFTMSEAADTAAVRTMHSVRGAWAAPIKVIAP